MKKQNRYGCLYYCSIKKYRYLVLRDLCWGISAGSLLMPEDDMWIQLGWALLSADKRSLERTLDHVQANVFGVAIKEVKGHSGCLGCL